MRSRLAKGLAFLAMVGCFSLAPPLAQAEMTDDSLRKNYPKPSDNSALQQWRDSRSWRYSTDYLFGVTRGLKDQAIPPWCGRAAWIVTVPFDIANLPFGALAGLFGD